MTYDPLSDVAVPPPPDKMAEAGIGADSLEAARHKAQLDRIELVVAARTFVKSDALAASIYATHRMSPTALRETAAVARVPDRRSIEDQDLRRVLFYLDAQRKERGLQPYAVEPVEMSPAPAPLDPARPVKIQRVPLSPTNQWKVTKTAPHVALPGGQFTLHEGTILNLDSYTPATIQSLVDQGVKLEAYPVPVERHTCPACDTSWPSMYGPISACPGCALARQAERHTALMQDADDRIAQAHAGVEELRDRLTAMGTVLDHRIKRHAALIRWAVDQGARPPDGEDGDSWQGEPHPPPLAHVLAARNASATPPAGGGGGGGGVTVTMPAPATDPEVEPTPAVVDELAAVAVAEPAADPAPPAKTAPRSKRVG